MADTGTDHGPALPRPRRRKLWEIDSALHCSLVGTCLTLGDLRRIESRLKIDGAKDASDFQIHGSFVIWAGKPGLVAQQMHKMLERRYKAAIRRYAAADDPSGLRALWAQSREDGDVPGPYWALLTHPAADSATMMWAFGQVHMLSHLVGAANRADIRRLTALQGERDDLVEALGVAKRRLAEQDRDTRRLLDQHAAEVRDLSDRLSATAPLVRRLQLAEERIAHLEDGGVLRALQAELASASDALTEAAQQAEAQRAENATLVRENERLGQERDRLESSLSALATECEAVEALLRDQLAIPAAAAAVPATAEAAIDLCGRRIVYVGGRGCIIPHLRALVERAGGEFLHHDGGLEEPGRRLDGLLGHCDAVFCPIDCISHDACLRAKRACRQRASTFVPLRTGSLSSFIDGLRQLAQGETGRQQPGQPMPHNDSNQQ